MPTPFPAFAQWLQQFVWYLRYSNQTQSYCIKGVHTKNKKKGKENKQKRWQNVAAFWANKLKFESVFWEYWGITYSLAEATDVQLTQGAGVCVKVCVPHPQCKAINQKYVNNKTTKPKQQTRRHTHTAVTGKRGNFNYGHNGRPLGSSACRRHMPWTRDQNITEAVCGAVLDPPLSLPRHTPVSLWMRANCQRRNICLLAKLHKLVASRIKASQI